MAITCTSNYAWVTAEKITAVKLNTMPSVPGITLAASSSITTSGAFALTLTTTAATNVTLPTTGTLSTLTTFAAPPAIGNTTPAAGAFTTLSATTTASIGGTAAFGGSNAPVGRSATFSSTTGDRLRVWSNAAGNGTLIDCTDVGETTSARQIAIGASNGTVLLASTALASSTGLAITGALTSSTGFGCNGKTAQTAYASGGVLANVVAALVANGILSN